MNTQTIENMNINCYVIVDPVSQGCFLTDNEILNDESMLFYTVKTYKEADMVTQNTFVSLCLIMSKEVYNEFSEHYYIN